MNKWKLLLILLLIYPFSAQNHTFVKSENKTTISKRANFKTSYDKLRRWEGNYVNHPNDKGGETYGGITRKYNPDWYGWKYINGKTLQRYDSVPEAEHWVLDFYLDIWVDEGFDQLENQELANVIFDLRIHTHKKRTCILINRALEEMGLPPIDYRQNQWVNQLKSIDIKSNLMSPPPILPLPKTIFNTDICEYFLIKLNKKRKQYYYNIVRNNESQRVFIDGWIKRSNSINV
jgi:hypothetical protein